VSKATKRHCAGTVQSQGGRVGNVKQVSSELKSEDNYGRCGVSGLLTASQHNRLLCMTNVLCSYSSMMWKINC